MSLAELAPRYLEAIEAELHQAVGSESAHRSQTQTRRGLTLPSITDGLSDGYLSDYYTMLEYHLGWTDGAPSGKRIRPLLCLLCCSAAGGDWQQALPLGAAIELIHNFSLIHDDIQDNSDLRRGRPTVWKRWGQAQAINAGDAMFTLAHLAPHRLTALGVPPEVALAALVELDDTCLALTQGQHLDMAFEQRQSVNVAEYLAMIERKTAALIAAATYLGARLGRPNPGCLVHYYAYGWNLGVAFQLQDDLLGIWGDPAVTGKSAASDLEKRKKSLPVVYGLEHSREFAEAYAQPYEPGRDVAGLAASLEQLGAREYCTQLVQAATGRAREALDQCDTLEPAGQALRELTEQLLDRQM